MSDQIIQVPPEDRRGPTDRRSEERKSDMLPLLGAFGPLVTGAALLSPPSEVSYGLAMLGAMVSSMALFSLTRSRTEAISSALHFHSEKSEARRVAYQDPLTGLPNRLAFRQQLDDKLTKQNSGDIVVLFADLDKFKEVNDGFGHDAGDALLVEIARRCQGLLEDTDLLARLGGDEFAAILCGDTAIDRAETLAMDLIETITEPVVIDGDAVTVGVSIGIAEYPVKESKFSAQELIRRADIAMYRAKADTRHSYCRFTSELDDLLVKKRSLRADLDKAIEVNDQLRLEIQPIFCARSGKVASGEVLMRWRHPTRGEVAPNQFIPLAEESVQIIKIGDWAINRAIEHIKELNNEVPLAVNISPLQFRHHNFARSVSERLLHAGVPPRLLKIEITEGVLISHNDHAMRTIRQLRNIGVQVVLDDFGTGFSSLSYLQSFDFDVVKIDRSFVRHIDGQHQSRQLTRAIVDMGHGLDMQVVAEGVENARQASLLQLLGCDLLQGYYLGVPSDVKTFRSMVEDAEINPKLLVKPSETEAEASGGAAIHKLSK